MSIKHTLHISHLDLVKEPNDMLKYISYSREFRE